MKIEVRFPRGCFMWPARLEAANSESSERIAYEAVPIEHDDWIFSRNGRFMRGGWTARRRLPS